MTLSAICSVGDRPLVKVARTEGMIRKRWIITNELNIPILRKYTGLEEIRNLREAKSPKVGKARELGRTVVA